MKVQIDKMASHIKTYSLEFPSPLLKGGNKQSKINKKIEKAVIGCDALKMYTYFLEMIS